MDVRGVEQIVEAVEGLEGEQGDVGQWRRRGSSWGRKAPVPQKMKWTRGIARAEGWASGGEEFEALLGAHVAGVEEDDFVVDAGDGGASSRADGVAAVGIRRGEGGWSRRRPSWGRGRLAIGGNAFGCGALDHLAEMLETRSKARVK